MLAVKSSKEQPVQEKKEENVQFMNTKRRNILFDSAIQELKLSTNSKDSNRFIVMFFLSTIFMFAEMVTGVITASLTLTADSLHMLTDIVAIIIGYIALRKAHSVKNKTDHFMVDLRYETVGAFLNATMLLTSCFIMALVAFMRMKYTQEVENLPLVLIVGGLGLVINIVGLFIFHQHGHDGHGHSHHKNLNIHAVFLHILADLFGSIIVMISTLVMIYDKREWTNYVDPGFTFFSVILISACTYPMMKRSTKLLLSISPFNVKDINQIETQLQNINGILNVHELYCFEVKSGHLMATVHLIIDWNVMNMKMNIIDQSKVILHAHGIHSSVIQTEYVHKENNQWINSINPCFDYICDGNECISQGITLSNSLANLRRRNQNENDDKGNANQLRKKNKNKNDDKGKANQLTHLLGFGWDSNVN